MCKKIYNKCTTYRIGVYFTKLCFYVIKPDRYTHKNKIFGINNYLYYGSTLLRLLSMNQTYGLVLVFEFVANEVVLSIINYP